VSHTSFLSNKTKLKIGELGDNSIVFLALMTSIAGFMFATEKPIQHNIIDVFTA